MPTLAEQLASTKIKADQARARQRKIEARLDQHNRRQISRLFYILGEGATTGDLADQCLKHVGEAKRTIAQRILKEQADNLKDAKPEFTDRPQNQTSA